MVKYFSEQMKENSTFKAVFILFAAFTLWWITILYRGYTESWENDYFTITYPIISLIGGIIGWIYAKKWGGLKSKLGISISMFSFGLLAQFLGQLLYNFYIFQLGIDEPYPSTGDVSFFASIIFYIVGATYLAKVSGLNLSMRSVGGKIQSLLAPLIILILSYALLLKDYEVDFSNKIVLFLDLGYPIGQAIFVSIAFMALLISKNILGGVMRKPIMLLIAALVMQYIADFAYTYQVHIGGTYNGDYLDYLYLLAYFLMTTALLSIGNMFYKVQKT